MPGDWPGDCPGARQLLLGNHNFPASHAHPWLPQSLLNQPQQDLWIPLHYKEIAARDCLELVSEAKHESIKSDKLQKTAAAHSSNTPSIYTEGLGLFHHMLQGDLWLWLCVIHGIPKYPLMAGLLDSYLNEILLEDINGKIAMILASRFGLTTEVNAALLVPHKTKLKAYLSPELLLVWPNDTSARDMITSCCKVIVIPCKQLIYLDEILLEDINGKIAMILASRLGRTTEVNAAALLVHHKTNKLKAYLSPELLNSFHVQ
eukprot:jgi/Psemu1/27215/gm1.27215_g